MIAQSSVACRTDVLCVCMCVFVIGSKGCCSTLGCRPEQLQSRWQLWQLPHTDWYVHKRTHTNTHTHSTAPTGLSIFTSRKHRHRRGEGEKKRDEKEKVWQFIKLEGVECHRKQGTNSLSWTNKHGWLDWGCWPAGGGDTRWHSTPKYLHPIFLYKWIQSRWMDGYGFGGAGWRG